VQFSRVRLGAVVVSSFVILCAGSAGAQTCGNGASRSGASSTLPDCRAFENVSPPEGEQRETYLPTAGEIDNGTSGTSIDTEQLFAVADNGEALAYVGGPSAEGNGLQGKGNGNQYIGTRLPGGGWVSKDIEPYHEQRSTYTAFSPDLAFSLLISDEATPLPGTLAPSGGFYIPYLRTNSTSTYQALIEVAPSDRRVAEEPFGTFEPVEGIVGPLEFVGGNAGGGGVSPFQYLLFEANDVLTETATDPGATHNNLYEWHAGALSQINILPAGSEEPANANAVVGGEAPPEAKVPTPDAAHAISADGNRVFWTDLDTGRIYVRIGATATDSVSTGPAQYWNASTEGTLAYYTEAEQLWAYNVASETREALTGPEAGVQAVVAVNEEGAPGEYVYFVAAGVLAEGATEGQPNLYVRHAGATTLVVTLQAADNNNKAAGLSYRTGDWAGTLAAQTTQASADGRAIVFMSKASLTGYPNGELSEVYQYEAPTGRLTCVSCDPSGALPPNSGAENNGNAAVLPVSHAETQATRWISSDGGRVVFDSIEPLTAQDRNSYQDVYEWERAGDGTCEAAQGCIYLLSGGFSSDASALLGMSSNGGDVFIVTRAQLTALDHNEFFDAYDARENGIASVPAVAQCAELTCERQQREPPPPLSLPPTALLTEAEEAPASAGHAPKVTLTRAQKLAKALKLCHRQHVKSKRVTCERKARKLYRAHTTRKVTR
jgi:hypothetical protein